MFYLIPISFSSCSLCLYSIVTSLDLFSPKVRKTSAFITLKCRQMHLNYLQCAAKINVQLKLSMKLQDKHVFLWSSLNESVLIQFIKRWSSFIFSSHVSLSVERQSQKMAVQSWSCSLSLCCTSNWSQPARTFLCTEVTKYKSSAFKIKL